MAKSEEKPMLRIMSDEEFRAMKLKENKESFLDNLIAASNEKGKKRFSVRDLNNKDKPTSNSNELNGFDDVSELSGNLELSVGEFEPIQTDGLLDDDAWSDMLNKFNNISPIDDITTEDRLRYRKKNDGDKYDAMFDKERSMLNDVLSDLQSRSKIVNTSIKNMVGSKPSGSRGGISKTFTELVEAGNSLDTSKLQVIKALVDIKKTAIDLRIKEQKNLPAEDETDVNTIADQFYKQITNTNINDLRNSAMNSYGRHGIPIKRNSDLDDEDDAGYTQFNISQPHSIVNGQQEDYEDYGDLSFDDVDKHGYIRNEARGVDVFVNRYEDGSIEFVALDEDGMRVDDYELPDPMLLDTMTIKPMSPYAYDEYSRKYKIIDVSSTVDIGDIDSDELDNVTDDDKYDID